MNRSRFPFSIFTRILACTGFLLALPCPASAIDANEQYLRVGYGTYHCDSYVVSYGYQPTDEAGFTNWVAGYITAINKALPDTYDIKAPLDLHGVMDWVLGYCDRHEHQNDSVADAIAAFVTAHYPVRRTRK